MYLGITDAERRRLAVLYATGQQLWRVPIAPFSPWDCNWPYGPPTDALPPSIPAPTTDDLLDADCLQEGSMIECQNQTLGERMPIVGTPFGLNYRSDRVPGRTAARTLTIQLTGETVPASLLDGEAMVEVGGRVFKRAIPPLPNQQWVFTWDGRDAYGRAVQGRQPVTVRIGYRYPMVYYSVPEEIIAAFGRLRRLGAVEVTPALSRQTFFWIWQTLGAELGIWDARGQGLGGWTLDPHHAYNPVAEALYLGDGSRQSGRRLNSVYVRAAGTGVEGSGVDGNSAFETVISPKGVAVAPDGTLYFVDSHFIRRVNRDGNVETVAGKFVRPYYCVPSGTSTCGEGGPARDALLYNPEDLAFGPDGSLYFTEPWINVVRRVTPDGILERVAGNGTKASIGDGGPATQASLYYPRGLAVGNDGSVYIGGLLSGCVRRVGSDGIITTLAGTCGTRGRTGDGGPASDALLFSPWSLALGPDGSLYIGDLANSSDSRRVRKVTPDGTISAVAGNGGYTEPSSPLNEGGLATQSRVEPWSLAVGLDRSLYIGDNNLRRVRRVTADGVIRTVAGNGTRLSAQDEVNFNRPAPSSSLTPQHVAMGPDGSLYVSEGDRDVIGRIRPLLQGLDPTGPVIVSADGRQAFVFNGDLRHMRTLSTTTGAELLRFAYDPSGLLVSVHDADGNVTAIERDAEGHPVAVVGPFGQRTGLTVAPNGYLAADVHLCFFCN